MKLKSYKILSIDEKKGHFTLECKFDDEGKEIIYKTTKSFNNKVAFDDFEMRDIEVKYKDEQENIRTRTEKHAVKVIKYRKGFDITNSAELDGQIKEWASAYMLGLEQVKANKQIVSPDVESLIGKENKTQIL